MKASVHRISDTAANITAKEGTNVLKTIIAEAITTKVVLL